MDRHPGTIVAMMMVLTAIVLALLLPTHLISDKQVGAQPSGHGQLVWHGADSYCQGSHSCGG